MDNLEPGIRNAVRAVIVRDEQLLLLHKDGGPRGERYALPGGAQDAGETLLDALQRECVEEIGSEVQVAQLLHVADYFKPRGIPMSQLDEVVLTIDELEAIRLADLDEMYQEAAAQKMKVSRQTFGRIVAAARKKVAEALVEGKALRIDGGEFEMPAMRAFRCRDCDHEWRVHQGTGRPAECPGCQGQDFCRADSPGRWASLAEDGKRARGRPNEA